MRDAIAVDGDRHTLVTGLGNIDGATPSKLNLIQCRRLSVQRVVDGAALYAKAMTRIAAKPTIVKIKNRVSPNGLRLEPENRHRILQDIIQDAEIPEHRLPRRLQKKTCADRSGCIGLLINAHTVAESPKEDSGGKPANAAADDCDIVDVHHVILSPTDTGASRRTGARAVEDVNYEDLFEGSLGGDSKKQYTQKIENAIAEMLMRNPSRPGTFMLKLNPMDRR